MERVAVVRVIHGDTDAMGIAYYGSYFRWFEVGRVELMRSRGFSYREVTGESVHLPVVEAHAEYRSPARYDDLLEIRTSVRPLRGPRLTFDYRIERASDGKALVEGYTVHAFVDAAGRPVKPSARLRALFGTIRGDHDPTGGRERLGTQSGT